MNLWLRLIFLLIATPWRARLSAPFDVSRLRFTVLPTDLDTSMHMNNGRYWTLMDLGRADLLLRTGLWRAVLKRRWTPLMSAGLIRFRRELRLFRSFTLETEVLAWSEDRIVIEHRILRDDGSVGAIALVETGLYDRARRAFVPVAELMKLSGVTAESPPLRPDVAAFLAAEGALKTVTSDGPAAPLDA
ncbi:thioesterase family protein [Hansschlegelia zhihuaiae]|uniref:Thioesterase n=1 Tax=Hansschlegelia zhihuaiae TaxID=405005 RepID=A0A4Q0MLJ0_9HYPH|nr:thioesterase family protein [Hansschlegelia zhihuaiae]RXF74677.1 thioesterase [Hansschlegelia zhihuaiae]